MYEGAHYDPRNSDDYENFFDGASNSGSGARSSTGRSPTTTSWSCWPSPTRTEKLTTDKYGFDPAVHGTRVYKNTTFNEAGGDNWSPTYTGYLTDNFDEGDVRRERARRPTSTA